MVEEYGNYHGKYFLTLIFASVLLFSFGILAQNVFAMGPTACYNQYNDPITSFTINNGTQTFDALANPGVTFNVGASSSYTVTFVLHTPSTSSWGNSNPGDALYNQDVYGFYQGACVYVNSNQNLTVSEQLGNPWAGVGHVQPVLFGAYSSGATYNVRWITMPSAPQNLQATAGNAQVTLSWSVPSNNGDSAITNYNVYRGTSSGSEMLLTQIGNVTSYNDISVTNGKTYFYKVTAVNSVGESPQSNEVNATTQQTPTLSVAVITNKPSYPQNSTIYVAVVVKSNSNPISGASITFHVCNPNNNCMTGTGTTNSNGNAIFKLAIPPNALTGTYTVDTTASKSGYTSGSGKTTFQVT